MSIESQGRNVSGCEGWQHGASEELIYHAGQHTDRQRTEEEPSCSQKENL